MWLPQERRVRWSDIPNNRIVEWDADSGRMSVFRENAEYTNGRRLDHEGRVVQCSHGRRAVEREEPSGTILLVDRWEGGRFNSPNDVIVASDGALWFTDPPYGLHPSGREGRPGPRDYPGCYVFRFDPSTGDVTPVVTDMIHPNGLAFSPDESVLYVSDTGSLDAGDEVFGGTVPARVIRAYPTDGVNVTGPGHDFAHTPVGVPDGFVVDEHGNVWTSAGDGVYVFAPDGERLGHIGVPETVANVCFGGDDGTDLFIAASTSLYRISTRTHAAA